MAPKQCRTCRNYEEDVPFREISAFYAQVLLDFDINVPRVNVCSTICNDCEDFLAQYESFKKMCKDTKEYFERVEKTAETNLKRKKKVEEADEFWLKSDEEVETVEEVELKQKDEDGESYVVVVNDRRKRVKLDKDNEEDGSFVNMESLDEAEEFIIQEYDVNNPIEANEHRQYCELCNKNFTTQAHLRRHLELVHVGSSQNRNYRCPPCNLDFPSIKSLNDHRERVHQLAPGFIHCDYCDEIFHKSTKGIHMEENHKNQCKFCFIKFPTAGTLRIHMHTHSDLKNYMCQICNTKFFTEKALILHLEAHSKPKEVKWKCEECGKVCKREQSLIKHRREEHTNKPLHVCKHCGKECRSQKHYESHILKHMYAPKANVEETTTFDKEVEIVVHDPEEELPDFIEVVRAPVLKPPSVKLSP